MAFQLFCCLGSKLDALRLVYQNFDLRRFACACTSITGVQGFSLKYALYANFAFMVLKAALIPSFPCIPGSGSA